MSSTQEKHRSGGVRWRRAEIIPFEDALDARITQDDSLDVYLGQGFMPWRRQGRRMVIACTDDKRPRMRPERCNVVYLPMARAAFNQAIALRFRAGLVRRAVQGGRERTPGLTASLTFGRMQIRVLCAGLAMLVAGAMSVPVAVVNGFVIWVAIGYGCGAFFRLLMAAWFAWRWRAVSRQTKPPVAIIARDLPVYTVLAPLYRETSVLPQLAKALDGLCYPRDRLDIKLVVEEDDLATLQAAEAVARRHGFEVVAVPVCHPRTKPKALNFALPFARGEFLVVFDAEDRPDPDQLLKAVAAYRAAPDDIVCLQARLTISNSHQGLLPALFATDYAIWFGAVLPWLELLRAPMPLGGTSNHFRTAALHAIGGWDPFNVTEDADLGLRLTRAGWRVRMLDSATLEDAPLSIRVWLKQRSRWLKGYMQTVLVHSRDVGGLVSRAGLRGTCAIIYLFLGALWSALVNPILWGLWALSALGIGVGSEGALQFTFATGLALLFANCLLTMLVVLQGGFAAICRIWFGLAFVLNWLLIPLAAWRGLAQLVRCPFHWEKTPHSLGGG